jgi:hypothetical protein
VSIPSAKPFATLNVPGGTSPIRQTAEPLKNGRVRSLYEIRELNVVSSEQPTVIYVPQQSQAIPALTSFFLPGLGQLIQGRLVSAGVWFCLSCLAWLSTSILIGFLLVPVVTILCVLDAARYHSRD